MRIMTAGYKSEKTLHVWSLVEMKPIKQLVHKNEIRSLEISNDGTYIYAGGQGGVYIWDLRNTDEPVAHLEK